MVCKEECGKRHDSFADDSDADVDHDDPVVELVLEDEGQTNESEQQGAREDGIPNSPKCTFKHISISK